MNCELLDSAWPVSPCLIVCYHTNTELHLTGWLPLKGCLLQTKLTRGVVCKLFHIIRLNVLFKKHVKQKSCSCWISFPIWNILWWSEVRVKGNTPVYSHLPLNFMQMRSGQLSALLLPDDIEQTDIIRGNMTDAVNTIIMTAQRQEM